MNGPDLATKTNGTPASDATQSSSSIVEQHSHFRSILDATHDAFFLLDREFKLLTCNRAFADLIRKQYDKPIIEHASVFDLLPRHNHEMLENSLRKVLNGEYIEMENMIRNEPPIWFHVHLYPIQDKPGSPIEGITVCLRDISERKMAEVNSEELLKKYRSLIENGLDANYQFNIKTNKFEYFSPVVESISGFTAEEIISWSHDEAVRFIHDEDRHIMIEALGAALQSGKVSAEYRCRRKDGVYRWVVNRANLLKDEDGHPSSLVGSIRDIDKQKKAELSLLKSEEEYRALVENSLDATYHLDFTTNQFVYISPVMEKISGYPISEIAAWSQEENLSHVHPDDLSMLLLKMEQSVGTGRMEAEYRTKRKDGRYVWVSNTSNIIRDSQGKPLLGIGSIRDITDRKETEQALVKSEQQYRTLVEHASEGILILNPDGSLIEANSHVYKMLGYGREEFSGHNLLQLILVAPNEPPLRLGEVLAGFTVVQERNVLKSNGEKLHVELSCKMLPDFRILVIVRDLTERNRSKKLIEEKENTFQHLFHYSGEGFFIGDNMGILTDVNEAGCSLLGYPKPELLGRNFQDFIERDPGQGMLVLDSLRPGKSIVFSRKARNSEGKIRTLEIHAIRLPDNRLLGITHDITEKREEHRRIAESEVRFRTLFESSMEGILLNDDEGTIIAANPAACKMFGMTKQEMCGLTREKLTPLDTESMAALVNERRLKGYAKGSLTFMKKDGSTFETNIYSSQFKDQDGKVYSVVNIHDLTEKRQIESAKLESEIKFRKIFDIATVATVVGKIDGDIIETNEAFCKMLQYSEDELRHKNFLELTHPDDLGLSNEQLTVIHSGRTKVSQFEKRYFRKDGTTVWVLVSFTLFGTHADGTPLILSHLIDISDRKVAVAALEESEKRYKTLFDKATFGIVTMSPAGQVIALNEAFARMHGYTIEELGDIDIASLNVPESREKLMDRIKRVLNGEVLNFEVGHYHKDGHILTVEVTTSAIQAGKETYIQSFIRDITELKKAAAAVQSTELRYTTLFEQASIGISFIGMDEKFININEAYARMHGYTIDEILQMNVHELNVPDSRMNLEEIKSKLFAGETLQYQADHYHKNGSIITVEITTSMVQVGTEKFIQSFLRDITALKKLKADADDSENRYRSLFEESNIGILFVSENGEILNTNQACADMHGYTIDELKGFNVKNLLPKVDQESFGGKMKELLSGKNLIFRVIHIHRNGTPRIMEINARAHNFYGRNYIQSFVRDITDITRAEQALAESELRYKTIFDKR